MSSDEGDMAAVRAELVERSSIGLAPARPLSHRLAPWPWHARRSFGRRRRGDGRARGRPPAAPRAVAEAVQRSRRSIIAASAAHPAFVRVLDSGETSDGRSFMVMELAEGRGLHEVLAENEPLEIVARPCGWRSTWAAPSRRCTTWASSTPPCAPATCGSCPQGRVKLMDLEIAGLRGAPELHELLAETAHRRTTWRPSRCAERR